MPAAHFFGPVTDRCAYILQNGACNPSMRGMDGALVRPGGVELTQSCVTLLQGKDGSPEAKSMYNGPECETTYLPKSFVRMFPKFTHVISHIAMRMEEILLHINLCLDETFMVNHHTEDFPNLPGAVVARVLKPDSKDTIRRHEMCGTGSEH